MRTAVRPRPETRSRMWSPTTNSRSVRSSPRSAVVNPVATTYGASGRCPDSGVESIGPLEVPRHREGEEPGAPDRVPVAEVPVRPGHEAGDRGCERGAAERLLEVHVPFARREAGEPVVVILVEEVRAHREGPGLPLEAVAQSEGCIAAGARVEVVMDAQGWIQHAVAGGLEVELLRGDPPVAVGIREIGVAGGEGE